MSHIPVPQHVSDASGTPSHPQAAHLDLGGMCSVMLCNVALFVDSWSF
jgi:hypothetical protein